MGDNLDTAARSLDIWWCGLVPCAGLWRWPGFWSVIPGVECRGVATGVKTPCWPCRMPRACKEPDTDCGASLRAAVSARQRRLMARSCKGARSDHVGGSIGNISEHLELSRHHAEMVEFRKHVASCCPKPLRSNLGSSAIMRNGKETICTVTRLMGPTDSNEG